MNDRCQQTKYPLDNAGILHMATLNESYSNSFRVSVTLSEKIDPKSLQKALCTVTPRFPTMAAGIQSSAFRHWVVPVAKPPDVQPDSAPLAHMSPEQVQSCAMRVLYRDARISLEFFHSLTDGYGAFQFLKALLAAYLKLTYGVDCSEDAELLLPDSPKADAEAEDSFAAYVGKAKARFNHVQSYQMSGKPAQTSAVHITSACFPLNALMETAHENHVTLTTLLTAVMAASIMEAQVRQGTNAAQKPVQVMVPVNLRTLFPSRSLRNFSLYALPRIQPGDERLSLEALLKKVDPQLKEQLSRDFLQAMISTNVSLERNLLFRLLPLRVRCAGLDFVHRVFGVKTSSLTLSNLGTLQLPEAMRPYVRQTEVLLTPREYSSYNCGMISYDGQLHINFSRKGQEPELERVFIRRLKELGHIPVLKLDDTPVDLDRFLQEAPSVNEQLAPCLPCADGRHIA